MTVLVICAVQDGVLWVIVGTTGVYDALVILSQAKFTTIKTQESLKNPLLVRLEHHNKAHVIAILAIFD